MKETLQKLFTETQKELSAITQQLETPALDGNVWLLTRRTFRRIAERDEPTTLVYGIWGDLDGLTKEGWLAIEAVPSHPCGALLFDSDRADRHLETLTAIRFTVWKTHIHDFLRERRAYLSERLKTLRFDLVQCG